MVRVILTGSSGFLGNHLLSLLTEYYEVIALASTDYDLRRADEVDKLFSDYSNWPNTVIVNLAANVGGIGYNRNHPYHLFYDNAAISLNLIHASVNYGVKKFVQIGTVCAYPKYAPIPFKEESLWDGYPEETNAPYGLAKKMSLAQLQAARDEFGFNGIFLLPTNLYGPGDEFGENRSHVIPALIKKFVHAKEQGLDTVTVWGSGEASRDFVHVTDAAQAILAATKHYNNKWPLNIGSGNQVKISVLAFMIAQIVNYDGKITYNSSMPDGQPKRALDISNIKGMLEWEPEIDLVDGLKQTIQWYKENHARN